MLIYILDTMNTTNYIFTIDIVNNRIISIDTINSNSSDGCKTETLDSSGQRMRPAEGHQHCGIKKYRFIFIHVSTTSNIIFLKGRSR